MVARVNVVWSFKSKSMGPGVCGNENLPRGYFGDSRVVTTKSPGGFTLGTLLEAFMGTTKHRYMIGNHEWTNHPGTLTELIE